MRASRYGFVAIAFLVTVAACGSGRSTEAENVIPHDAENLIGTEWKLVANEELFPITDDHPVTLRIEQGTASGQAPCNTYNLSFTRDGEDVTTGPIASTKLACEASIAAAEAKYFVALEKVDTVTMENDRLVLSGPDDVSLVYARARQP